MTSCVLQKADVAAAVPQKVVCPAPPADKKAKMEDVADFSLAALIPTTPSKV